MTIGKTGVIILVFISGCSCFLHSTVQIVFKNQEKNIHHIFKPRFIRSLFTVGPSKYIKRNNFILAYIFKPNN